MAEVESRFMIWIRAGGAVSASANLDNITVWKIVLVSFLMYGCETLDFLGQDR